MSNRYDWTACWYDLPANDAHLSLVSTVQDIENRQSHVHKNNCAWATTYSGRDELIGWGTETRRPQIADFEQDRVSKQVIDTASSIIAKNRPRLRASTYGGDWKDRTRAKKLEKFLWGDFKRHNVYELVPKVFRDAAVFGTGVVKICEVDSGVALERVLIDDIVVDERTCLSTGLPREIFQRRLIELNELAEMFPEHKTHIMSMGATEWVNGRTVPEGYTVIIEAWRLGTTALGKGRHSIVCDGATLLDEKWSEPWFPFLFYRWNEPLTGFYGSGIVEELYDIQQRLNKINKFIQVCQNRFAVPRIFMDAANRGLKTTLTNRVGTVVYYRGQKPIFETAQALTAEIYNERERLRRLAFERIGVSQLSAQSLKPAGLESAVALREFNEIEGQRFVMEAQRLENFYRDLGYLYIEFSRRAHKGGHKVSSVWNNKNVIEQIDWSDVDMPRDRFILGIEAASILSMNPASRLQAVTELAQVGQLEKQEIRYLLNHPDLERSDSMANADYEIIEKVIAELSEGGFMVPEPFMDLELGIDRVSKARALAQLEGAPDDVVDNYMEWVTQAEDLVRRAQAEEAAASAAAAGAVDPMAAGQNAADAGVIPAQELAPEPGVGVSPDDLAAGIPNSPIPTDV